MNILKNNVLTAILFSLFLLFSHSVQAAQITDNQTVDQNKTWTIRFNNEISFDDLTKNGITVTDKAGKKVAVGVQLGENNKTVVVTAPAGGYIIGEEYTLKIENKVHSNKGKQLNEECKLNFNIKSDRGNTKADKFLQGKIKSANLSYNYNIEQVLSDIDKFQLNTLNIPVVVNIENTSSSDVTINKTSEEKAIKLIEQLKGRNIKIILEAYPLINNGGIPETEWIPKDTNAFFLKWKTEVLKTLIDDIANKYNIDALNIGSNFDLIESEEENWCETIDYVKTYYKGLVTYRTNKWDTAQWDSKTVDSYKEKLNNKLFSKVDFISIAAYFELTNNPKNTVENLVSAIESTQINDRKQNVKQEIKNFYDKWNKPIFFGELGFPKTDGASVNPWKPDNDKPVNNVEQANCFEAYKREFQNEPWFLGFSVFAIGEEGNDNKYYPSEKSVEIIRSWYNK